MRHFIHVCLFIFIEIIEKWACPFEIFVDICHTLCNILMHMPRYPVGPDVRPPDKSA